jgi:hypothetical protein
VKEQGDDSVSEFAYERTLKMHERVEYLKRLRVPKSDVLFELTQDIRIIITSFVVSLESWQRCSTVRHIASTRGYCAGHVSFTDLQVEWKV